MKPRGAASPAGGGGWIVGVLLEADGGARQEFFVVAREDRARAEWAAADLALSRGAIASSPRGGAEPVEAMAALTPALLDRFGVAPGAVKALGPRWPRRWLAKTPSMEDGGD
jgi:hypothetical protein